MNFFYDQNQVRYRLMPQNGSGSYNWIFLPGGPGCDSNYLSSLTELLKLPGNVWMIDLPGSGGNAEGHLNYDFDYWLKIFMPMIQKFENPILVGHSFGGMFPLLFPELEEHLKGMVILHSAPTLWMQEAALYAKKIDVPSLAQEMQAFIKNPNQQTFDTALEACMPYYFPKHSLEKGSALFKNGDPFQFQPAVWWQKKAVEMNFSAKWVPQAVPTLIIGGKYDCMCPFSLFQDDKRFHRPNIKMQYIEEGGHLSWVENPQAVKEAFTQFLERIV